MTMRLAVAVFAVHFCVLSTTCKAEDEGQLPIVLYRDPVTVMIYPSERSARTVMLSGRYYPDVLTLLTADAYQPLVAELDLSDMQRSRLQQSARSQIPELKAKMDQRPPPPPEEYLAMLDVFDRKVNESVDGVLLPVQRKKLTRIGLRLELLSRGLMAFESSSFSEPLELDKQQRDARGLRDKQQEFEEAFRIESDKLYRKMLRVHCRKFLNEEQNETLDLLTGSDWGGDAGDQRKPDEHGDSKD